MRHGIIIPGLTRRAVPRERLLAGSVSLRASVSQPKVQALAGSARLQGDHLSHATLLLKRPISSTKGKKGEKNFDKGTALKG